MAITTLTRYTDDFDGTVADTEGGLPEGWLQLTVSWSSWTSVIFSSIDNATAWFHDNNPAEVGSDQE